MSLLDYIGFFFGLVFLIVMGIKKAQEERRRREHPEEYQRQQREIRKFLQPEEFDDEEEEYEEQPRAHHRPPPPPPKPATPSVTVARGAVSSKPKHEEYKIKSTIQQRNVASKLDSRYQQDKDDQAYASPYESKTYDVIATTSTSRVGKLIKNLPSKKSMVILREILGPPKGLK